MAKGGFFSNKSTVGKIVGGAANSVKKVATNPGKANFGDFATTAAIVGGAALGASSLLSSSSTALTPDIAAAQAAGGGTFVDVGAGGAQTLTSVGSGGFFSNLAAGAENLGRSALGGLESAGGGIAKAVGKQGLLGLIEKGYKGITSHGGILGAGLQGAEFLGQKGLQGAEFLGEKGLQGAEFLGSGAESGLHGLTSLLIGEHAASQISLNNIRSGFGRLRDLFSTNQGQIEDVKQSQANTNLENAINFSSLGSTLQSGLRSLARSQESTAILGALAARSQQPAQAAGPIVISTPAPAAPIQAGFGGGSMTEILLFVGLAAGMILLLRKK